MKAFSKCFAVVLTAASLLTLGGCAGTTVSAQTATTANWNVRTSAAVEGNMLDYWTSHKEVATYAVSFKEGSNSSFSVEYGDLTSAVYTTSFYAEAEYDWTAVGEEDFRVSADDDKALLKEPVYVYETSLKTSGSYKVKSGDTLSFDDEVTTVCKYRLAGKNLQPMYSLQIIKNTAPNTLNASKTDRDFDKIDAVYETWYNQGCSQAVISYTDNLAAAGTQPVKTTVKTSTKRGYSVFDNSQLRAAVRAFTLTGGTTKTFNVLTPQNKAMQMCTATVANPAELRTQDAEEAKIIAALNNSQPDDYIFFDGAPSGEGENKVKNYRYTAVSLSINADMKGASPTCWYTTVENADLNTTRSVLIKLTTPLAFGLGTLSYSLSSLNVVAK